LNMSEHTKKLKEKMDVCVILQRKFGCKCAINDRLPFCNTVEEIYNILKQ